MAWTYELQVTAEPGRWYRVGVRFPTEAEAKQAGLTKMTAWTACEDYRVVEVDELANHRLVEGVMTEIPQPSA
jgi:hypothetical protein